MTVENSGNRKPVVSKRNKKFKTRQKKLTKPVKTVDLNRKLVFIESPTKADRSCFFLVFVLEITDWSLLTVTVSQPITASRWY